MGITNMPKSLSAKWLCTWVVHDPVIVSVIPPAQDARESEVAQCPRARGDDIPLHPPPRVEQFVADGKADAVAFATQEPCLEADRIGGDRHRGADQIETAGCDG